MFHQVMEKLFEISIDYWESFLNVDEENMYPNQYNTPQTPEAGRTGMADTEHSGAMCSIPSFFNND